MTAEPTADEVRAVLALVSAALDDPDASDEVTELEPVRGARMFGVQPSEKRGSSSFVVRISREP